MRKSVIYLASILTLLAVGLGSASGGYRFGSNTGYDRGFKVGYQAGNNSEYQRSFRDVINSKIKIRLTDTNNNGEADEVYLCFQNDQGIFDRSRLFRSGVPSVELPYDACLEQPSSKPN